MVVPERGREYVVSWSYKNEGVDEGGGLVVGWYA